MLRSLGHRQKNKVVRCAWSNAPCRSNRGCSHLAFSVRDRRGNAMATLQVGFVPAPSSIFYRGKASYGASRTDITRRHALAVLAPLVGAPGSVRAANPEGQLTWG